MRKDVEAVIIGSGPAGMAAAVSLRKNGIENVIIVEREPHLGGILLQCIHNGFGLHHFDEELTGPEYAERYVALVKKNGIEFWTEACVIDIIPNGKNTKRVMVLSKDRRLSELESKTVILAMGCRERNRGNINIPGGRPAGIMTAGTAQKLVNMYGYLPGREIVILGSGDIGLIMARRLTWEGARVKAVVEVQSYPGGLNRNLVQCLHDFDIPLYLSHTISKVVGHKRLEAVEIAALDAHFEPEESQRFMVKCDTLLLSVGLIPENELSLKVGVELDPVTHGPSADAHLMTNVEGIFACGNVLQVHDLADGASEEGSYCGKQVAEYLQGTLRKSEEIPVKKGHLVRYVLPARVEKGKPVLFSLRPIAPAEKVLLEVKTDTGAELYSKYYKKVYPSIMIRFEIDSIPKEANYVEVRFHSKNEQ